MTDKPYEIYLVLYKPKSGNQCMMNIDSKGNQWGEYYTSNPSRVYNALQDSELDVRVFRIPDMSEVTCVTMGIEFTKPIV